MKLFACLYKMVRVLNVAEKNDAAKLLSEIMSNGRYRRVCNTFLEFLQLCLHFLSMASSFSSQMTTQNFGGPELPIQIHTCHLLMSL